MVWFCLTLPIVGLLTFNEYVRFQFLEETNHYISKWKGLKYVFIGDSITAGGRNWGWSLSGNPFSSRNFGCSGYTVHQVLALVPQALECRPKWVFVMAGTNDFLNEGFDQAKMLADYKTMLESLKKGHTQPVVTLTPQSAYSEHSTDIAAFNSAVRQLCADESVPVIDLNPTIAPQGTLLPRFTIDGVHFTPDAYTIWIAELLKVIHAGETKRD